MKKNPFEGCGMLTLPDSKACLVRSVFSLKSFKKAELIITALGYFGQPFNAAEVGLLRTGFVECAVSDI